MTATLPTPSPVGGTAPVPRDTGTALAPLAPAGSVPWSRPEDSRRSMAEFVSSTVGIVRRTSERQRDTDDILTFSTAAEACAARPLLGVGCNRANGGAGGSRGVAWVRGVGETVERYSNAFVPWGCLWWGSFRELSAAGVVCVSPGEWSACAGWQYEGGSSLVRFSDSVSLWWVESRRLSDGVVVWVPAAVVYLDGRVAAACPVGYATSSGLAFGGSVDEALVGGVLELVERDAVMMAWYQRLSLPLVDVGSDRRLRGFFDRHVVPTGLSVSLVDLSVVSGVSVVLAVTRNRCNGVAPLGLGAAASADPLRAVMKAVDESMSTRGWSAMMQRDGTTLDPNGDFHTTVDTFDDHVALYSGPDLIAETEFLDSSSERVGLGELPVLPGGSPGVVRDAVVGLLASQGVELFGVDSTSPDVGEVGGRVVRVFSPQLVPLDSGYARRQLGSARLYERPVELGLVPAGRAYDINPLPHPFP